MAAVHGRSVYKEEGKRYSGHHRSKTAEGTELRAERAAKNF